jgi:hypothetical protein
VTTAERIRHFARRSASSAIAWIALASIVGVSIAVAAPTGPQVSNALPAPVVADVLQQQATTPTAQQACAGPVIDDFSTGPHHAELQTGSDRSTQTGSMLGGERTTVFAVPTAPTNPNNNPYGLTAAFDILPNQSPLLVVSTPYKAFHGADVFYGLGRPFDMNFSCYDRFRVHFAASDLGLNINMQVGATNTNGVVAQCGRNVPGQTTGVAFDVDFPFDCFVVNAGPLPDFHHLTQVRLLVQSGSAMAANDYAIGKIEATGTATTPPSPTPTRRPTQTPCPLLICLPL